MPTCFSATPSWGERLAAGFSFSLVGARASASCLGDVFRRSVCQSGCTQLWLWIRRRESGLPHPGSRSSSCGPEAPAVVSGALRQPHRRRGVGTGQTGRSGRAEASSGLGALPGQPGRTRTVPLFSGPEGCTPPARARSTRVSLPGYRRALLRGGGGNVGRGQHRVVRMRTWKTWGPFSLQLLVSQIDRFRLDSSLFSS